MEWFRPPGVGEPDARPADDGAFDTEHPHDGEIGGAQALAGAAQHFAFAGIGSRHQHAVAGRYFVRRLGDAAVPGNGLRRHHGIAFGRQAVAGADIGGIRQHRRR